MIVKYKIIETHTTTNQIVVRYYSDTVTEEMLGGIGPNGELRRGNTDIAITLPVPAVVGDELHTLIMSIAPEAYERLLHAESYCVNNIPSTLEDVQLGVEFIVDISKRIVIQNGVPITHDDVNFEIEAASNGNYYRLI